MVRGRSERALLVVVMGVAGSGKTRIGTELAARLALPYADADAFHPKENVAKMAGGVALTDADRWPWLAALGAWLAARADTGAVLSCSALRRAYRDVLTYAAPATIFLHLDGDPALIRRRVATRASHFMPVALVDSQLALLEPLGPDERGVVLDLDRTPSELVDAFLSHVEGALVPRYDRERAP